MKSFVLVACMCFVLSAQLFGGSVVNLVTSGGQVPGIQLVCSADGHVCEKVHINSYLTAASPGDQGDGLLVTAYNHISIIDKNNDAVTLPEAGEGIVLYVINDASRTLEIWPSVGDAINSHGVNNADTLRSGKYAKFVAVSNAQWIHLIGG